MLLSGTVGIDVSVDGGLPFRVTDGVAVMPRIGSMSWVSTIGGRRGAPGEMDRCFLPFRIDSLQAGLTSGSSCSRGNEFALFTPASPYLAESGAPIVELRPTIASGPNTGLTYVQRALVTMQLRTQLRREFRQDGPLYPVVAGTNAALACGNTMSRTIRSANLDCFANSKWFNAFSSSMWTHEDQHMASALQIASTPSADLHMRFFGLVGSPYSVMEAAALQYDLVQANVYNAALSTHAPTGSSFDVWMYHNSVWQRMLLLAVN